MARSSIGSKKTGQTKPPPVAPKPPQKATSGYQKYLQTKSVGTNPYSVKPTAKLPATVKPNVIQTGYMAPAPITPNPNFTGKQAIRWNNYFQTYGLRLPAPPGPSNATLGLNARVGQKANPYVPPTDSGGGDYDGGGGGYYGGGGYGGGGGSWEESEPQPVPITWSEFDSGVANKPSWWKAMKPSSADEEGVQYLAMLNMMIPFLSPEDQRSVAANLYQQNPEAFSHLNPELIGVNAPGQIDANMNSWFTSSARANNALSALNALAGAVGKDEKSLGTGYRYLRSILDTAKQFGGAPGSGQTRAQYLQMLSALDPLMGQAESQQLSAYGPIAKMLSQPFFSAGQLVPIAKTNTGAYVFGNPDKSLL